MTAAIVSLGLVVAVLGVLVIGLLRSHADVLRALHELGVGEEQLTAPERQAHRSAASGVRTVPGVPEPGDASALGRRVDVAGIDPDGGAVNVGLDGSASMTLLAFLSTGCSTCHDFWRAFDTDEVDRVPGDATRIVIVTRGPDAESPAAVAELAPARVTTVMSSEAWDDYDVPVAPYFLLVDGTSGVVGEGASTSWDQVVDLIGKAAADAGVRLDRRSGLSRRELLRGRDREARADRELRAAGIEPGAAELYEPANGPDGDGRAAGAP
jgi:hypothetical protein